MLERCPYCDGTGRRDVPLRSLSLTHSTHSSKANPAGRYEGDRGSEAKAKAELYGSFQALEAAMTVMRDRHPAWHRALLISLGELEGEVHAPNIDSAYRFLDAQLPAQLRVPYYEEEAQERKAKRGKGRHANPGQQSKRDDEIMAMYDSGKNPGTIALRYGITVRRVFQIVGKSNGKRAA